MGKNKKHNKWNNQPRKQSTPTVIDPTRLMASKTAYGYWLNNLTEEERQNIKTPIAVAQRAGVVNRLGYLTATFYHLHSVQSLIFGEMQNIVEDWGLLMKGVQPVINSLQNSEDKFFNTMRDLVERNCEGIKETYMEDVDALFDRITRWEGIPKSWKPGDPQKLEGQARMDDIIGSIKNGMLKMREQNLEPEPKEEARIFYTVGEMTENEMSAVVKQDITKKGLAVITAKRLAKKNPGKMFVVFEQRMQLQDTCHMKPFKAVQMPEYSKDTTKQSELVEIDITPAKA